MKQLPRLVASMTVVTLTHLGLLAYVTHATSDPTLDDEGRTVAVAKARSTPPRLAMRFVSSPKSETVTPFVPPLVDVEPAAIGDAQQTLSPDDLPSEDQQMANDVMPADTYAPRSALTKAPKALTMIDIPFPEGLVGHGTFSSTLALYIDETGSVRKVEVTGQPLPPPLEEAARLSFLQASFEPGQVNGQSVKARITIEVTFDDTMQAPEQQAASTSLPAPV